MPRKSKEELIEKNIVDTKKTSKVKPSTVKEKETIKKETTKKTSTKKGSAPKKNTTKKISEKKSATSTKKSTKKGQAVPKANGKDKLTKTKSSKRKENKLKNISNKPKKLSSAYLVKSINEKDYPFILEYYDLPYKYNKTVIKALPQNPNTLFAYWEISDEDIKSLKEQYGDNVFDITKPVLVIHNLTDKYSFEIDINDFANNWYIHVNDSKCQYVIELVRKSRDYTNNSDENYIFITSSNMTEVPNDHVLFYDSEQIREVRFKNIHTNKYTTRVIRPFLRNIFELYKSLNLSKEITSFDFKNPSSQNPTSNLF